MNGPLADEDTEPDQDADPGLPSFGVDGDRAARRRGERGNEPAAAVHCPQPAAVTWAAGHHGDDPVRRLGHR